MVLGIASSSDLDSSSLLLDNILKTYPSPLASYEDVVANKDLFMTTLKKLHSQMGTKFWNPKVRFVDLDLHKLFVEVTSRGGIEQIVREEKWKDVFDTFNFPYSQRNPIFTQLVRTHYYSLLHDYEIIYFFNARGQFPPFIGLVYGKIKSAYLVTFTMGSLKLEGVLYESKENNRVTQDPEKKSYDLFPNTLSDRANPHKLFVSKRSNQWNKNKEVGSGVLLQHFLNQEATADPSVFDSEEEDYYSDLESEQRSAWDESESYEERQ